MNVENVNVIKRYVSNLDSDLVLALVSMRSGKYVVEIIGEELAEFQNEAEAISYSELRIQSFYIDK